MKFRTALSGFLAAPVLCAPVLCAAPLQAQSKSGSNLPALLARLDTASQHFSSATADFSRANYERVVRDTTTQNGAIYFIRKGAGIQMGAYTEAPGSTQKQQVIAYKDGLLQMFDPGVDQITVLHAGSNQAQYESFLTLGFGGSGSALAREWNITDLGPEPVAADPGVKAEKLDLVSKDPKVRNLFTHVTIWVDPARDVSLQQIFYAPSGDMQTATYSNIKVNSRVNLKSFEIKKDSHTTIVNR